MPRAMSSKQRLYRVTFHNQGQVYELYCKGVSHGGLLGFVEIEGIVFGEKTSVLVDPGEERLKSEFAQVSRTYVPVHAIIRIDEVSKAGAPSIRPNEGESAKVMPFPIYTKGTDHQS